ncbi:hypothetical protein ACK8P5_08500 [Paenibacillus sp. EC2-1]|uniref:hypothetical protein n=1 Tax=Paenibacillus sp. EC2-1 TaxID=3388665 RepID=UPI003BEF397C
MAKCRLRFLFCRLAFGFLSGVGNKLSSNRYNYLFDLLTGKSAYTNSAGNSDWAREQLVSAFLKSKEAEYSAMYAMGMAGGIGWGNKSTGKNKVKSVANMDEFFKMKFGKSISNSLSKTKVKYDGQSIYRVEKKTNNQYLKKGYGVYLDGLHKDHLEVIDKTGYVKYVLNLNGTLNPDKTKKALGRVVKDWK